MTVFEDICQVPQDGGYACAIGFFDGVHLGHKALLTALKKEAAERGLKTLIVTFKQHPREIMKASYVPSLLTTTTERLQIMEKEGIDACYLIKSKSIFEQTSSYFMHHTLAELNVKYLLVGYDHHFGSDREHGFEYYKRVGAEYGIEVGQAEAMLVAKNKVSSSAIRRELEAGKVDSISKLLGYNYFIEGTVVHGRNVGKIIGFPTANICLSDVRKLIPMGGVYSVKVNIEGERKAYKGVLNIGVRPTFIDLKTVKTIEVHILDFNGDLYGKQMRIEFVKFLRSEEKFETTEQLTQQISEDLKRV